MSSINNQQLLTFNVFVFETDIKVHGMIKEEKVTALTALGYSKKVAS